MYDLEMLEQMGFCSGIENYSRHLSGRSAGEPPPTPDRLLPEGLPPHHRRVAPDGPADRRDVPRRPRRARRRSSSSASACPRALDNRPLKFEEFERLVQQAIYVSATPGRVRAREGAGASSSSRSSARPASSIRRSRSGRSGSRSTTCSARSASAPRPASASSSRRSPSGWPRTSPSTSPRSASACRYLHSDIDTLERIEIIRDLRRGEFDVLVGINLLREGLDIPEVSLVAILDADKEGFLRSAARSSRPSAAPPAT